MIKAVQELCEVVTDTTKNGDISNTKSDTCEESRAKKVKEIQHSLE